MLINEQILNKTIASLEKNNMKVISLKNSREAIDYIKTIVNSNTTTGNGGSMTLVDSGIISYLEKNTKYQEDRSTHHSIDCYFTSANAITENGQIYQVDGHSNRISAIVNGPKKVIIVASVNKIVKDEEEAKYRVMKIAAPKNAARLSRKTPCCTIGECIALTTGKRCESPERICSNTLIMEKQTAKDRITVVLVTDEALGY